MVVEGIGRLAFCAFMAASSLSLSLFAKPHFESIPKNAYLFIEDTPWFANTKVPLDSERIVSSNHYEARLLRTDGSRIPYDQSEGIITISPINGGEPIHIKLERFRSIEMRWINDRLLYIWMNLGRIYSVDAIFDAIAEQWIYRSGIVYETN